MGVLAERLEGDGIMNLSGGFTSVVECNEVRRLQRLWRDRVDVVVLPIYRLLAA